MHTELKIQVVLFVRENNRVERGLGPSLPLHRTYGSVYGATSWYGFRHYCLLLRRLLAKFNRFTCPPFQPLRVTIPSPWLSLRVRATVDLLTVTCNTTTLGPSGTVFPTMASADSRSLAFFALGFALHDCSHRLADRVSRGKTRFFRRTTSGFTVSVLRLPFGL